MQALDLPGAIPTAVEGPVEERTLVGAGLFAHIQEVAEQIDLEEQAKQELATAASGSSEALAADSSEVRPVPPPPRGRAAVPSVSAPGAVRLVFEAEEAASDNAAPEAPPGPTPLVELPDTIDDETPAVDSVLAESESLEAPTRPEEIDPASVEQVARASVTSQGLGETPSGRRAARKASPTQGSKHLLWIAVSVAVIGVAAMAVAAYVLLSG